MSQPNAKARPGHLRTELRDAVSGRAVLLMLAVLAIGLGFIGSYLGAFQIPLLTGSSWASWCPERQHR